MESLLSVKIYAFAAALVIGLILAGPLSFGLRRIPGPMRTPTLWGVFAGPLLCCTLYGFSVMALYALLPIATDRWDPLNLCMAIDFWNGHDVYQSLEGPPLVTSAYGPLFYVVLASGSVGPGAGSLVAAKLPPLFALVLALPLIYRLSAPTFGRLPAALIAMALTTAMCLELRLLRPDSAVCLLALLGANLLLRLLRAGEGAATSTRRLLLYGALAGLIAALIMDLKLTSIVVCAPLGALLVSHFRWRPMIAAVCVFALFAVLPWLPGMPFDIHRQMELMRVTSKHGLDPRLVVETLCYSAICFLVIAAFFVACYRRNPLALRQFVRQHVLMLLASAAAWGVLALGGMKDGAGYYYLLPHFPILLAIACRMWDVTAGPADQEQWQPSPVLHAAWTGGVVAVIVLLIAVAGIMYRGELALYRLAWATDLAAIGQDVENIAARHPDERLQIGYGSGSSDWVYEAWEPMLAAAGQRPLLLRGTVQDCRQGGYPIPSTTMAAIRDGEIKRWLIPKSETPFMGKSSYSSAEQIFDDEFREAFAHHYALDYSTASFDVYVYQGPDQPDAP